MTEHTDSPPLTLEATPLEAAPFERTAPIIGQIPLRRSWLVTVDCPYCHRNHNHAVPYRADVTRYRRAHCGAGDYRLEEVHDA